LGHVERCAAVLHLVDASSEDPAESYRVIRNELVTYGEGIENKPEIVVLTKCDLIDEDAMNAARDEVEAACGQTPLMISSATQLGLKPVLFSVYNHVKARREKEDAARDARLLKEAIRRGEAKEEAEGWSP
jgi:GTP-binding protein